MPQIVVSHSDTVSFDRQAFARELHREAAKVIDASLDDYKTRFLPIGTWTIGDGDGPDTLVHVDFGLLSGRSEQARAELAARLLDLLRATFADAPPRTHLTVEVREMNRPTFAKHITA
ncbi:5-carboxymethyl-2-hydroxymuconate Delta-isomerase [Phytomonospora endophytica]|uniref:5-carboxymethyl-2-hydroxymuconate isomerase n=1 Tax=Phytomonospora endophytica TaxID=714109 RepID=A0A841G2M7_9ACTN|nr:isomerase [Phytomonospora endophytica]MBB6038959.1 5-carboxymethyl-2-hydroxymuconate isomerase [Phytomonospora endophytica]GIG67937.1 hypothetical protein Pen01_42320 [Phytomonospora endophytica]